MKQIIIDRMNDAIDKNPHCLVDYADENEIGNVHAAIFHKIEFPTDHPVHEFADDYLRGYLQRCKDRFYERNYLEFLAEYEAELASMEHDRIKDERLEAALEAMA